MPSSPSRPCSTRLAVALVACALALPACGRRISETESDGGTLGAPTPARKPTTSAIAAAKTGAGEGWNAAQIAWQPYDDGLREAKAQNKPVLLVFSTTWCPHCKNYSHVFEDPRVVASAHDFVMVHLDADANEAVAAKYALDGSYIPRTYFLAPDGTIDNSIHAPRPTSRFFYDEHDPAPLLAAMDTAKKKLVN
jgi:thiol-disulfide isomerase/thioredoxin